MSQNESFNVIIQQAAAMFRLKGYHHTSIADIAKACHLNKSSIYHHVASKKDLACRVVEHEQRLFKEQVLDIIDQLESSIAVVEKFITATATYFADKQGGCLVANLVLEVAADEQDFKQILKPFFEQWCGAMKRGLSAWLSDAQASQCACELLALWQGLLMLQQVDPALLGGNTIAEAMINHLRKIPQLNVSAVHS